MNQRLCLPGSAGTIGNATRPALAIRHYLASNPSACIRVRPLEALDDAAVVLSGGGERAPRAGLC